jgi:cobaltochelatase CobT
MNKEDNFKEKFKQALISTAKVISDDYKPNTNKQNVSSNNFNFFELDNLNSRHDFIRLRAETDSEALKKNFVIEKFIKKICLIILLINLYMIYLKRFDMSFLAQKC